MGVVAGRVPQRGEGESIGTLLSLSQNRTRVSKKKGGKIRFTIEQPSEGRRRGKSGSTDLRHE